MRHPTSLENIRQVMQAIGNRIPQPLKIYFTGGTTCVMKGWREATVDIALKPVPDLGKVYDVIAQLKEELSINIETAAPDHFLPPLPGWEDRSEYIDTVGQVQFFHYDSYSQILSKVARGFKKDLAELVRYPALDEKVLSGKVQGFLESRDGTGA